MIYTIIVLTNDKAQLIIDKVTTSNMKLAMKIQDFYIDEGHIVKVEIEE